MSTLSVNNVTEVGGAPVVTNGVLDSGSLPAGSVLQVVSTQKTTSFATSSTSLVDITDLSVTITPQSSSSKFLVFLNGFRVANDGTNGVVSMGVARDATDIGQESRYQDNTGTIAGNISVMVLDSPATASAITYKGRVRAVVSTATVYESAITVMEVAG